MKGSLHFSLVVIGFFGKWQLGSGFAPLTGGRPKVLALQSSTQPEETMKMLEKAKRLRQEAEAMESKLREERGNTVVAAAPEPVEKTVKYQQVPGSAWTITYRFADEPVKDRDDDDEPLEFYRGQLNLLFRPDGYTDLVSGQNHENGLQVTKVWGWDEELSPEDGKRYLLFSFDAKTPTSPQKQRFYFQALIGKKEHNEIGFSEGTVTIKQDLAETKKAMGFGFFSAKGILAQFRYVGDFSAKAIRME